MEIQMNSGEHSWSYRNGPKTYSIKNLSFELNIGRTKIYELIKEGKLKIIKIGDRSLVTAEDLDAFIASLRAT
jgi:excisionase family DNA binding protein